MLSMIQVGAILCVLCIVVGQVLMRSSALAINAADTIFDTKVIILLASALTVYCLTAVGWIYILQKVELGKVYPFQALSFMAVPLASYNGFRRAI